MNTTKTRRRRGLGAVACGVIAAVSLGVASGAQAAQPSTTEANAISISIGNDPIFMPNAWRTR